MNILHTVRRREVNWIGNVLRRNCLLKHIIKNNTEGEMEVRKRERRRRRQVLDNLKGLVTLGHFSGGN